MNNVSVEDDVESLTSSTKKMAISSDGPTTLSVAKSDEDRDEKSAATEVSLSSSKISKKEDYQVTLKENGNTESVRDCGSEEASAVTPNPSQAEEEDVKVTSHGNENTLLDRDVDSLNKVSLETPNPSPTASPTLNKDKNVTFIDRKDLDENPKVIKERPKASVISAETRKGDNISSKENENTREQKLSKEVEEPQENTINLLGHTNDEQARQYVANPMEEKELNEAVAELTSAISKNPNLSKVQKEFFLELAADPEGTGEGSIASFSTQNSIQSLRKATDFIQEDLNDRERLREKRKKLRAPKKATRETSVNENLWKAHAKRIAPKAVLQHMRGANDRGGELGSSESLILNKFKNMKKQAKDEYLHSSMPITSKPMHSRIRDITIDDIATPKRSNANNDETNQRLSAGGGAGAMGLVMPDFSGDEDDDDDDDDDIDAFVFHGNDDNHDNDAYQIDYPEGFKFDHDDNDDDMDMGSITDSLLTDNSNDYDNSLLDSYYDQQETEGDRPDTTVLFSADQMPSSLESVVRRAGEHGKSSSENHEESKRLQPILRNNQPDTTVLFSGDRLPSSLKSEVRRAGEQDGSLVANRDESKNLQPILLNKHISNDDGESSVNYRYNSGMPSMFLKPEIREDFGEGFEIIAQGYHFDDASVADTESLSSFHPWTGVVAHRSSGVSQCSVPSLRRCDAVDDQSLVSLRKSHQSPQNSVPSLHRCDAVDEQSLLSLVKSPQHSVPSLHPCDAVDEQTLLSVMSARQRAASCPNASNLFKTDNAGNTASLGDDLTALDDASVSYKKVKFSGVSFETDEKYPEEKEDNKPSPDGVDSLTLSSEGKPESNGDDKAGGDHFLNDDDDIDNCSWSIATLETKDMQYDAWDMFKDDYVKETVDLPFEIFGTSATDVSSMPHVLSPPLLDSLRHFVPDRLYDCNMWMKYSLLRDGASMSILLRNIRGSNAVLLAIETTTGDVFGCYTNTPWKKTYGYFGTGECFVWKMKQTRGTKCHSLLDQVQMESEVEVFAFSNENDMTQVCKHDFIAVGGGTISDASTLPDINLDEAASNVEAGFAIALDEELLNGTTSPCATFLSPCLTNASSPTGEVFEVVNMEAWTFTPCATEEQAERNELSKMFRDGNTDLDVIGTFIGGNGFGGGGSGRF